MSLIRTPIVHCRWEDDGEGEGRKPALKFCNRSFAYAAPTLWNGLPKDLRQFAHPPNPPLNFTYPPLALSSRTFHSRLKRELFKISYPGSTPTPSHLRHHHKLQPQHHPHSLA